MRIATLSLTRLLCLFATASLAATPGFAQQPPAPERRTLAAERLAAGESITLDGELDEAVWRRAQVGSDFRQIDPDNGMPATEQTEVRIAFDSDAIYLGVIAHDSEGSRRLTRYQKRRDEALQSDDKVQWTIDTFLDGRSGYFFETNASGAMADALMGINGSFLGRISSVGFQDLRDLCSDLWLRPGPGTLLGVSPALSEVEGLFGEASACQVIELGA